MQWLINFWYQQKHPLRYLFYPFHLLLCLLVWFRQTLYKVGLLKSYRLEVPVIVVGNITVGGTGKSPTVIHLAKQLGQVGYNVGIVSRGYGGKANEYPVDVQIGSDAAIVGDEPLMIRQSIDVPVVVDPNRAAAGRYLVERHGCNLIICDDGLQHYALQRDIELVVVDGERLFGNGLLMPFGPLREPVGRLGSIHGLIVNNANGDNISGCDNVFSMYLKSCYVASVKNDNRQLSMSDFIEHCKQQNGQVHGVAAIGNPQRFFNLLRSSGLEHSGYEFSDHHQFTEDDFSNMQGTIIMTEKDAVKCRHFATADMWYLKVDADISPSISEYCIKLLQNKIREH